VRQALILVACLALGSAAGVAAQEASGDGAPDELSKTLGLATTVPESKGFVQQSRPRRDLLDFHSPYATDIVRPRPRSAAEVEALKRDLEAAAARNRAKGGKPMATRTSAPPARPAAPR
jgi:hypothetical protein